MSSRGLVVAAALVGCLAVEALGQSPREVYRKHDELEYKLENAFPDRMKLKDEEAREKLKPTVVPILKEMIENLEKIKGNHDYGGLYQWHNVEIRSLLYVFGDEDTIKLVDEIIKTENGDARMEGKYFSVALDYFNAKDLNEQLKVIERFAQIVKENVAEVAKEEKAGGESDKANIHPPSGTADFMLAITPDEKIQDKILAVLHNHLSSTTGALVTIKYESPRKLRASLNKPVTFRYPDLTGKPIQASDYKGKVLIVSFFKTTSPTSLKEVNRVVRLAITQKAKGLEAVSVSCDENKGDLTLWMSEYKRISWPMLFDDFTAEASGSWHPLALQIGVHKMPTTLLIDRKGVLRYANPKDLDAKVKELLEEK